MDDAAPTVQPDSLVPVARFSGSRLASAPTPSPFQSNDGMSARHQKVRRVSSGSSVGAAIVDVENSLESDVCIPVVERHYVILTPFHCLVESG